MFSIAQFKNNVKLVRPNLFYVEIFPPPFLADYGASYGLLSYGDAVKFSYRCEAAEMPGRTVATYDEQTYGPAIKFAYDITYNDITLQIIASEDMNERKVFERWMDKMVTPVSSRNMYSGGLAKYYNDYSASRLRIKQLNDSGAVISSSTLYNAYPIQLSPMNLSWEETNTYQRFAVTMTYRYYTAEFP